jgi:hypothetical protein
MGEFAGTIFTIVLFIAAFLGSGAYAVLGMADFRAARRGFHATAISFAAIGMVIGVMTTWPLPIRMFICAAFFSVAGAGLIWVLDYLKVREALGVETKAPPIPQTEAPQPQQHARFQVITIDISAPRPKLFATARITIINKGEIAATNIVYSLSTITSDHILTADEEDNGYLTAIRALPPLDEGTASEYNHDQGLIFPIDLTALTNEKYNSVISGKLRFYLLIVFAYKDRNTSPGQKIITEDCNQFFRSFDRRPCRGHTRTYLSALN